MFKNNFKKLVPDRMKRFMTSIFYGWYGNYASWNDAKIKSSGYDSTVIVDKVKASLSEVKEGSASYERDSVLFNEVQYTFPVLSALMWIAARNRGKLNVLDFGGSLGTTYYQNKLFLDSLPDINWCIVEQPGFVQAGRESFEDEKLHFYYSIEECLKLFEIDVVLLSSVLQYLEKPFRLLDQIKAEEIEYLIIDRTPFIMGHDRITVQKVHPKIYSGSYPCWFFNEEKFISELTTDYKLILEFDALDKANISSKFKGFIFQKRKE